MSTSSHPAAGKMLTLVSSDGEKFEVPEAVVLQSGLIKHMIKVNSTISVIHLHKVTSAILGKVIECCRRHADDRVSEEDLRNWDAKFVEVDNDTLQGLMAAAKRMEISSLLCLTSRTVAGMTKIMQKQETLLQRLDTDLTDIIDNFSFLLRATKVSDQPERNSQEAIQMEMSAARMARAADSLLKLVSELKRTTIFSSFASLNNQVERRVEKFGQLAEITDRLMEKIGEQASGALKKLEEHYYSSKYRTKPGEDFKNLKIKNDSTPEEEEEARRENQHVFDQHEYANVVVVVLVRFCDLSVWSEYYRVT